MKMPSEIDMRAAITCRDKSFDNRFVYAVITTGVFCRPSCAARAAKPENYRFFGDSTSALEAGFRACKRCRPMEAASDIANLVESARYIQAHVDDKLTLAMLSKKAGLSPSRYQRVFKSALGVSPKEFQDAARMKRLKSVLKAGSDIASAIFDAGYGSTSRVYGRAIKNVGMTPKAYRAGGAGEVIAYVCRKTSLGMLLMGATDKGVCFVQFGDSDAGLVKQIKDEFPNATIELSNAENGPELNAWLEALNGYLEEGKPRPDLPLDLRGTAFQIKVWQFLLSIPEGDVISYGELAEGIDKPKAFRAAASACGKNRIAVLVPCHRVLRGNGDLGGYRWGLEKKRALLDAERKRSRSEGEGL